MDFEIVLESFERWFKGAQLTTDDTTNIVMGIILVVLLIVLIVMLTIISIQSLFWTRIGWFFEDVWHWLKRQGYASDELNKLTCDWSMGLSKSIFKNRLGLRLKAIDLLRQYKSVAYVVNERGIRETHTASLPSYLLFSVTYKFNKNPKKAASK